MCVCVFAGVCVSVCVKFASKPSRRRLVVPSAASSVYNLYGAGEVVTMLDLQYVIGLKLSL